MYLTYKRTTLDCPSKPCNAGFSQCSRHLNFRTKHTEGMAEKVALRQVSVLLFRLSTVSRPIFVCYRRRDVPVVPHNQHVIAILV
jgi:hypothetical protein